MQHDRNVTILLKQFKITNQKLFFDSKKNWVFSEIRLVINFTNATTTSSTVYVYICAYFHGCHICGLHLSVNIFAVINSFNRGGRIKKHCDPSRSEIFSNSNIPDNGEIIDW